MNSVAVKFDFLGNDRINRLLKINNSCYYLLYIHSRLKNYETKLRVIKDIEILLDKYVRINRLS